MTTTDFPPAATLAARLSSGGAAYLPGDDGYDAARGGYNVAVQHRPALVVAAATAGDVSAAVRFADEHDLRVVVQATGHGPAAAAEGGVLIDTSRMTEVTVDPKRRTARVGAGVRWQQVIDAAAPHRLAAANGSSPTVGVVGYTLGGGLSPILGRTQGYAADHVLSIDLVTADGVARTVTAATEPELFWGLRGGRTGFGVVTAMEFRLFPLPHLYGGGIFFPGEHARTVLHAWRAWIDSTPDELTSSIAVLRLPPADSVPEPLRGRQVVHVRVAYLGPAADGARLIAPVRAAAPAIVDTVGELPYPAVAAIHADPVEPLPVYERSALLGDLPAEAVDRLVDVAVDAADVPVTLVEVRHLAGALRRAPREPNAVANRDAPFLLFLASVAAADAAPAHVAFQDRIVAELGRWTTGRTFANFLTPGDGSAAHRATGYPAEVHDKLVALRRQWDPRGRFA
ncbi:FAD-binding oxidoreductase [Asanoa sp. WMMD1127]|uniref:FAD-binding oxidoreductase n=1 Tax=Asanoa sp. WMMD1127 TaxID=3016107 RepID=UPI002417D9FB|nr:FAD-binding oxidoreductase [Asanoa sp. WMMD1127]MDG4826871.1 FAD-binding oxidoreductase [Asanoa sp. WMMD1127]